MSYAGVALNKVLNTFGYTRTVVPSDTQVKVVDMQMAPLSGDSMWDYTNITLGAWDTLNITSYLQAYMLLSEVQQCINGLSHFATRKGFETEVEATKGGSVTTAEKAKADLDEANRKVNMDFVAFQSIISREIWGRDGWEIINDTDGKFWGLKHLDARYIFPVLHPDTREITGFRYNKPGATPQTEFNVEDILYFVRTPIDEWKVGYSAIQPIIESIKLKVNLRRDLLEASKRHWAPMVVFYVDTNSEPTTEMKAAKMADFAKRLKPGQAIVHNTKEVEPKVINLAPNLVGIVRAMETADVEIFGNWQMPKALFSREKSLSKATLEYSLKALYSGPVEGVQRYYKREIEDQFYDRLLLKWNYNTETEQKFISHHNWLPAAIYDPELISALAGAYNVGAISREDFFHLLGWKPRGGDYKDQNGNKAQPEDIETESPEEVAEEIENQNYFAGNRLKNEQQRSG